MTRSWQAVLEEIFVLAAPALKVEETRWVVVGSAATALQGCRVTPKDIDILTLQPAGVYRFAEVMVPYTPASPMPTADHEEWHSSLEEPVSVGPDDYGYTWYFCRWTIAGVKVEVAHIVGPPTAQPAQPGSGMWEAGPEIWAHIREVDFRGHRVPVVPLEIQLQTNLGRGLAQRVEEIVTVLRREGYDRALAECALSMAHWEAFRRMLGAGED